jgi:hypothetical protein
MPNAATTEACGTAAVLVVVEEQRKALRAELKTLDSIAVSLGDKQIEESPQVPPAPRAKQRRSQKGTKTNSPAAAAKRREELMRFLETQAEPVSSGVIQRELGFTHNNVKTAVRRLEEEDRVGRTGESASTRYFLRDGELGAAGPPAIQPVTPGTISGRILERARDGATQTELASDLGLPEGEVREECGKLIVEGELLMSRRNGKPIYVANEDA